MPKVETTVAQRDDARATADALLAYAREAGLLATIDAAQGSVILRGGAPLAFNPNAIRRTLRVKGLAGAGAALSISAEGDALPWEAPRVRQALEGHRDALARRLAGGPAPGAAAPFAFCAAPASTGAPAALGGILLSGLFAVLAAMLVMGTYGLIQVNGAVAHLAAQGARIEALGETPVPTLAALAQLTMGDRIAAAAFFAVSLGWLFGGPLALAWGLGEILPRWSGLGAQAVLFVLLLGFLILVPAGPVLPSLLATVLLPAAARIAYGLPWSLRRGIPSAAGAPPPRPRVVAAVAGAFALLALSAGIAFHRLPGLNVRDAADDAAGAWEESAVGFRDRVLLGTAWGRALSDYYYRHTVLPAEAIRHPRASAQRLALVLGDPGPLTVTFRLGSQWMLYSARERGVTWFYAERAESPEQLASRLEPPPEVILWMPRGGDAGSDPFLAPLRERCEAVTPRLVIVGGPATLSEPGGPFAGARQVPLPVRPEALAGAIGAVLDNQDRAGGPPGIPLLRALGGLRGLLQTANLFLVLGAAMLAAGLVVWSAWAWGALGASAAAGMWMRRVAWVVGPAAALAGWGAIVLAAVGDAGGPCPPPVPLADPVAALTHGDPCERMSAAQQIMREGSQKASRLPPEARSLLLEALRDGDPRVRFWAAGALGAIRHRGAVPDLIQRLHDPVLMVRYRAARSLGLLGDAVAIEPLKEMMRSDDGYPAGYAREAIRRLAVLRGRGP